MIGIPVFYIWKKKAGLSLKRKDGKPL